MPFEPVRIIHASHLRLDHQLEGLPRVPDELHRTVEDATLAAFDYLLAACLDHHVDFLLLTGNTFDRHDQSLRAWAALEQGFELLGEHGIHVFVIPGETDPASAWLNGPRWPDNVTIFHAHDGGPVAAMRGDKPIATVRQLDEFGRDRDDLHLLDEDVPTAGPLRMAPFTIGVMPSHSTFLSSKYSPPNTSANGQVNEEVRDAGRHPRELSENDLDEFADDESTELSGYSTDDERDGHAAAEVIDYIALGGPPHRQTFVTEDGLAHHPGTTQGISLLEQGLCGATLVELDHQGRGRSVFIPTGIVRWERIAISAAPDARPDEIEEHMREAVLELPPLSSERIRVLNWLLPGEGTLEREFADDSQVVQWIERVLSPLMQNEPVRYLHQVDWSPAEGASHVTTPANEQADAVAALSAELMDDLAEISRQGAERWLESMRALEQQIGREAATEILSRISCEGERVHRRARRLGRNWFSTHREENDAA